MGVPHFKNSHHFFLRWFSLTRAIDLAQKETGAIDFGKREGLLFAQNINIYTLPFTYVVPFFNFYCGNFVLYLKQKLLWRINL